MFSFFRKKKPEPPAQEPAPEQAAPPAVVPTDPAAPAVTTHWAAPDTSAATPPAQAPAAAAVNAPMGVPVAAAQAPEPSGAAASWLDRLRGGLRKTGSSLTQVFVGTKIDEALYEELEDALLMADAGVPATTALLEDLRRRVKAQRAADPAAVKALLADAVTELLQPLEAPLTVGEHRPTVIMVAGVNGAGKTTSIGKLTRHLSDGGCSVLLAAGDTFRAAAREQLAVWAQRNDRPGAATVDIVSQAGGDPAAVTFDAVRAGVSRQRDVVIIDTAGRLPTQMHLMDELRKVHRVIGKAMDGAPHEVLLVVDGHTGQNALAQVKAFDEALGLTGLIVTKLDGTAKGGVLAAIARWSRERSRPVPVYFIGVGEQLADLQPFRARDFATALLS